MSLRRHRPSLGPAGLVLALAVLGCARAETSAGPLRVVDDAGDTLALERPAQRVVSLVPATTEILFALGAGGEVVGRTSWCDHPPAAAAGTSVGDGIRPNLEAVFATRPDLVVLYQSGQNAQARERLRALGIPALQLATDRLEDVARAARILGVLTGRSAAADSLVGELRAGLEAASVRRSGRRPKVLILVWDDPPMTVGRGSFLHQVVERAGGRNLFADLAESSATISLEAVVARDPDLILVTTEGEPAFARRSEWKVVPAVRERRFVRAIGTEFSRPGPRAPQAVAKLAAALRAGP